MKAIIALCGGSLLALLVILGICAAIGAILWPYTINTWLVYANREAVVTWWHGALLGFCPFIGQLTIPAAVITFILMLIIG